MSAGRSGIVCVLSETSAQAALNETGPLLVVDAVQADFAGMAPWQRCRFVATCSVPAKRRVQVDLAGFDHVQDKIAGLGLLCGRSRKKPRTSQAASEKIVAPRKYWRDGEIPRRRSAEALRPLLPKQIPVSMHGLRPAARKQSRPRRQKHSRLATAGSFIPSVVTARELQCDRSEERGRRNPLR